MRSRGPRGVPHGRPLVPVAWGHVTWNGVVASWESSGGCAGEVTAASASVIAIALTRPIAKDRRHVVVTSHDETYPWAVRHADSTAAGVILASDGSSIGLSIIVYEEQ